MLTRITVGIIGALCLVLCVCLFIMGYHPAMGAGCLGIGLLLLYRAWTAGRGPASKTASPGSADSAPGA